MMAAIRMVIVSPPWRQLPETRVCSRNNDDLRQNAAPQVTRMPTLNAGNSH
jgi:hypothetical protein